MANDIKTPRTHLDQLHLEIAHTSKTFIGHIDAQIDNSARCIHAWLNMHINLQWKPLETLAHKIWIEFSAHRHFILESMEYA